MKDRVSNYYAHAIELAELYGLRAKLGYVTQDGNGTIGVQLLVRDANDPDVMDKLKEGTL